MPFILIYVITLPFYFPQSISNTPTPCLIHSTTPYGLLLRPYHHTIGFITTPPYDTPSIPVLHPSLPCCCWMLHPSFILIYMFLLLSLSLFLLLPLSPFYHYFYHSLYLFHSFYHCHYLYHLHYPYHFLYLSITLS